MRRILVSLIGIVVLVVVGFIASPRPAECSGGNCKYEARCSSQYECRVDKHESTSCRCVRTGNLIQPGVHERRCR
jgi:hypothetical protein